MTWTQKAPPRGSCLTLSPGDDIDDDKEDEDDGDGGDGGDGEDGDEDMMKPKYNCIDLQLVYLVLTAIRNHEKPWKSNKNYENQPKIVKKP